MRRRTSRERHAGAFRGSRVLDIRAMAGVLLGVWVVTAPPSVSAADAEAGALKARQACAVCHGEMGIASRPDAPHLAGQPDFYISRQLKLYRTGERKHEVMAVVARTLSDEDIENLAAWYSQIGIEVRQ